MCNFSMENLFLKHSINYYPHKPVARNFFEPFFEHDCSELFFYKMKKRSDCHPSQVY